MSGAVLAVVAHPDDESFGLGALLSAATAAGDRAGVLCLTHGEASTLHGVDGDLRAVREAELNAAAALLGVGWVSLLDHADGDLAGASADLLDEDVAQALRDFHPNRLLVFDSTGVTGHPDHVAATESALRVATRAGIPVLAWTIPARVAADMNTELGTGFVGREPAEVDDVVDVDRGAQLRAVHAHPSQAVPGSAVWRRLELLGPNEHVRWLRRPVGAATAGPAGG